MENESNSSSSDSDELYAVHSSYYNFYYPCSIVAITIVTSTAATKQCNDFLQFMYLKLAWNSDSVHFVCIYCSVWCVAGELVLKWRSTCETSGFSQLRLCQIPRYVFIPSVLSDLLWKLTYNRHKFFSMHFVYLLVLFFINSAKDKPWTCQICVLI